MNKGRVSFVFAPTVNRVNVMKGIHKVVAKGFGEDRGSCNRKIKRITFNNALVAHAWQSNKIITIYDEKLGHCCELLHCLVHSVNGSFENIMLVNIFIIRAIYSPGNSRLLNFVS